LNCYRSTLFLAILLTSGAAFAEQKFMRYPDVYKDRVVFTYGGDLWVAPSAGGTAVRLSAHPGLEFVAKFSPDGEQIAFTGQLHGDEQVYVMPSIGGQARQLTFYPAMGPLPQRWGFDNQVYGWTPDGQSVLFKSTYNAFEAGDQRAYTINAKGGLPVALPMPVSGAIDLAPSGDMLVYSPLSNDHRAWKKYQGGWAQDLYIFDQKTQQARNISNHVRTDRDPMWIGADVFFVSDRDGRLNLYRYDVATAEISQLTRHTDSDIKFASADADGQIVYELDGALRLFDTRTNQDRAIEINVPADELTRRTHQVDASEYFENMSVSDDGARALINARGDIYSVPTAKGITRNLTQSSNAHEREGAFSANGKMVCYISDLSGEEHLYVRAADGSDEPQQLTQAVYGRLYAPRFSPDGKLIAFHDKEGRLHLLEISSKSVTEIANDPTTLLADFSFSPTGRYLAYALSQASGMSQLQIYDTESKRSTLVSDPLFSAANPVFSADGLHLYFLSNREFAPLIDGQEWNYARNRQSGIFALTLRADSPPPLAFENKEAGPAKDEEEVEEDKKDAKADARKVKDPIDFAGLAERVTRIPVDADNYFALSVHDKRLVYQRSDAFYYGRKGRNAVELLSFDLEKRKEKVHTADIEFATVAANGASAVVKKAEGFKVINLDDEEANKDLDVSGLKTEVDPSQEWAVIFEEVWRRFRDHFYVENMHGYDWQAIGAQYRKLLPKVGHRADLNYLLSDMVGELNISHAYVSGGDLELPERPTVGLLGARFRVENERYVIDTIFAGQNAEALYRSPLTEVGVDAQVGDQIVAINGRKLTSNEDIYARLRLAPGQRIELKLKRRDREDPHLTVVEPITSETSLKYLSWVNANRRYTDAQSNGRVGYLHIPDMGPDGLREFIKWYYPQIRKQGLVVDVRGNGGGNVSQMLIERLNRKLLGIDFARGSESFGTYPAQVFHGHMATLISETSASDGDIFPYMFRQVGLGPLIGKRSWGGVVGITDWGPLIDGGSVNVPQFGNAAANGEWAIEGEGVSPDIEVDNDVASLIAGKDKQLDRAISEILAKIKTDPKILPTRPASPIK